MMLATIRQLPPVMLVWLWLYGGLPSTAAQLHTGPSDTVITLERESLPLGQRGLLPFPRIVQRGVTLALSGGGARGAAHLGVLRALDDFQIPIDGIVGSSGGALFGALYAVGYTGQDLDYLLSAIDWHAMFFNAPQREDLFVTQKIERPRSVLQFRFDGVRPTLPGTFSHGHGVARVLSDLVMRTPYNMERNFDRLKVPLRIVAADWLTGETVVFGHGDLVQVVMGSISVPLLFSPVEYDGRLLVDGGLVNTLPTDVALSIAPHLVMAVDVTSPLRAREMLTAPWTQINHMMSILQTQTIKTQSAAADLLLRPDLAGTRATGFANLRALEQGGYDAVVQNIDRIRTALRARAPQDTTAPFIPHVVQVRSAESELAQYRHLLAVTPGTPAIRDSIIADLRRLYATGDFGDVRAELHACDCEDSGVLYRVTMAPVVRQLVLSGNTLLSDDVLFADLETQPGQSYNYQAGVRDHQRILQRYRDAGWVLARIGVCTWDSVTGVLRIPIDEGRLRAVHVRSFDEKQPLQTREGVVLREFPLRSGDVFQLQAAMQGVRNIYGTGLFKRSYYTVEEGGDGPELILYLQEQKFTVGEVGGRFDTDRGAAGHVQLRRDNLLGSGTAASVYGLYGDRDKGVEGRLWSNRIFNSLFNYDVRIRYSDQQNFTRFGDDSVGEYDIFRFGGKIAVGRHMGRFGDVSLEGRFENVDLHSHPSAEFDEAFNLRTLILRSIIDTRDRLPFATGGYFQHILYERAGRVFGGRVSYTKLFTQIDYFQTFGGRHTIHPRLIAGTADNTLPFSEEFQLGGPQTFFGLKENILHGRAIFAGSVEYRLKLPKLALFQPYLQTRYDVGAVYRRTENPRIKDLQHAVGGGIAFDLPIGPLSITYGRSFGSFIESGEDHFLFSLGYALH